eukprot:147877-Pyramimonas_sp.AAC.1
MSLASHITRTRDSLQKLRGSLQHEHERLQRLSVNVQAVESAIVQLQSVLTCELDVVAHPNAGKNYTIQNLRWQVQYQKRRRTQAEDTLAKEKALRIQGSIGSIWYIRAGLSDPSICPRVLQDSYFEFQMQARQAIGRGSIGRVRDAMAEILKGMNRQHVASIVAPGNGDSRADSMTMYIQHIHDEACMRMRSYGDVTVQG